MCNKSLICNFMRVPNVLMNNSDTLLILRICRCFPCYNYSVNSYFVRCFILKAINTFTY